MTTPYPDLAAIRVTSQLASGQDVVNTIHVANPALGGAAPDMTALSALATDFWTYFSTTYRAMLTTGDQVLNVTTSQVKDPSSPGSVIEYVDAVNVAGSVGASRTAPSQSCAVLSLKTAVASRRSRGHLFLPPTMLTTDLSGQGFNGAGGYWINCQAFAAKLLTGCGPSPTWTGTTLSAYFLSIYSRAAAAAGAPAITNCTTVHLQNPSHWLRSRAKGTT